MEAHEAAFAFMKGSIRIEVPFFQRGYVWNQDNWKELIEDLFDTSSSHFLGSIILKSIKTESGAIPRWSLIDGQQRLTTLSVLLRACYDSLPLSTYEQDVQDDLKRDMYDMLFYKLKSIGKDREPKITHSMVDAAAFKEVITGKAVNDLNCIVLSSTAGKSETPSHSILQCYKYFHSILSEKNEKAELLWELLMNDNAKIIVKIDLDANENEQAIFDTVNSAGVRLTCADTIKNSLFQQAVENAIETSMTREAVIQFYEQTWESTFSKDTETIAYWGTLRSLGRITRDNLEILLHCVALIHGFFNPESNKISDLPQIYKNYIKGLSGKELLEFIQGICKYAETYEKFFYVFEKTTMFSYDRPIQRLFHILDKCDVSTFHAYVLMLLCKYSVQDEYTIPVGLKDELHNIEKIAIRYVICKVSTKNFNKNCADLIAGKITTKNLLSDKSTEIDDAIMYQKLCNIANKYATLLLFWVELKRRSVDKKCSEKELQYCYSLEHIMPQKWEQFWPISNPPVVNVATGQIISDADEAEWVRGSAVYEIGNMTLLNSNLNTSIRNYEFTRKVDGEGRKAGIRKYDYLLYTKDVVAVADHTGVWNEMEIHKRTKAIAAEVVTMW